MLGVVGGLAEVWLVTLALAALFVPAGRRVLDLTAPDGRSRAASYDLGAGFFLGLTLHLVCWRTLAVVVGSARLSCYLSLLALLVLAVGMRPRGTERTRSWPLWGSVCVLLLAFTATTIVVWLQPTSILNASTHFGSIHSGRYANPGIFVAEHDWIPRLGQNYGQSLLVTTHLLLGLHSPLASLTAWLAMSHAFLALAIFGWLRALVSPARAAAGAFLVLFCNITLSVTHVIVFDNGSPIGMTGYADVVASVATWLVFMDWLYRYCARPSGSPARTLLLPAVLGLGWTAFAPQNNLFGLVTCCALPVTSIGRATAGRVVRLATTAAVLTVATALGATGGGLLMPHRLADDVAIPGTHVSELQAPALLLRLQFIISHDGWLRFGSEIDAPPDHELSSEVRRHGSMEVFRSVAFRVESNLWTAGRIVFFPLLGMTALAWLLSSRGTRLDAERASLLRMWNAAAVLCFTTGFALAFCTTIDGFKWPLTRFLIPGVTLALVSLVMAGDLAVSERRPRLQIAFRVALVTLATFGPVVEFAALVPRQAPEDTRRGTLDERLHQLVEVREMLPEVGVFPRL